MIDKSLGEVIRALRDKADLSLRELADKVGVTAPFISDIELGKRYPADDKLAKIAQALGSTFDDLKRYDNRESFADLKRMMESDPKLGFAFRKLSEGVKTGAISAEDVMKLQKQAKGK